MKKFLARLCAFAMVIAMLVPGKVAQAAEKSDDIVVIFTNDVHCATGKADGSEFGYAHVAALKKSYEETHNYVTLVDAGDHAQGDVYGVLSNGLWLVDLMNEAGYDLATFGNHEFDYTVPGLEALVKEAEFDYISCNFIKLKNEEPFTKGYKIIEYGDVKVAYIGITTPETFSKSTPGYFKNSKGKYIYGFCEGNNGQDLYDKVQETVDKVKDDVDYVVALAHLGVDPTSSPWTSYEVIANTTGIDAVIDGHSHTIVPNAEYSGVNEDIIKTGVVKNADGKEVLLAQTGTKFKGIGTLTISTDGKLTTEFIKADTTMKADADVLSALKEIEDASEAELSVVAGNATYPLYITNPDDPTERLIRKRETNAGDFVADAYKYVSEAQIAVVNGGGIRIDVPEGEVTVKTLRALHPFGNQLCVVKATGQQILDLLEMSVSKMDENGQGENGGFQHVSGLTFTADLTIPSPVVTNDKGEFVKVDGTRRVKDVMVIDDKGKATPIDPKAEYTLASHNYMLLDGGDGLTMFTGDEVLRKNVCLDYEVVLKYFQHLNGVVPEEYKNPLGQGRITLVKANELPKTGVVSAVVFYAFGAMLIGGGAAMTRKSRKEN